MKLNYTVWWFEVDGFNGKVNRVYRDFNSRPEAREFAGLDATKHIGEISLCEWHHSHSSLQLSRANAGVFA